MNAAVMTVRLPWPRFDTLTPTGKPSFSKVAGKPLPWLSANVVNNMRSEESRRIKEQWREAAREAAVGQLPHDRTSWHLPFRVDTVIYKRTSSPMDSFAVLEGVKALIDGVVLAGALPADGPDYV